MCYIDLATTKFSMNKVRTICVRVLNSGLRNVDGNITVDPSKVSALEPIGVKRFCFSFSGCFDIWFVWASSFL